MKYKHGLPRSHMGKCAGDSHQRRLARRLSGRYARGLAGGLRAIKRAMVEQHLIFMCVPDEEELKAKKEEKK